MRILCLSANGRDIPNNERYLGESDETKYDNIKLGAIYDVLALMLAGARLDCLIKDNYGMPAWVPFKLFEVINGDIPSDWIFSDAEKQGGYEALYNSFGIKYMIGYKRLVESYSHYLGLMERNGDDIQIFFEECKANLDFDI